LNEIADGILTTFYPWVKLFFFKVNSAANEKFNTEQAKLQSNLLLQQAEFEEARNKVKAQREREAVEEAKIDVEISELPEEQREKAQRSVQEIRSKEEKVKASIEKLEQA
jgi:hypothetical protein